MSSDSGVTRHCHVIQLHILWPFGFSWTILNTCEGWVSRVLAQVISFSPGKVKIREVFTQSPTVTITKRMGHQQFPSLSEERQHLANAANLLKAFDKPATPVLLCEPFCGTVKRSYDPVDNIISPRSSVHSKPSQPSFNVCQES